MPPQSAPHAHSSRPPKLDLNVREPDSLRWVVDLIERFVIAHRGGKRAGVDTSGLGRVYRQPRGVEVRRTPAPQTMRDAEVLAVSRAWGSLPHTPWPWGQILRCSYLPGYPRPEIACRLMHIAPASWVRERNAALALLGDALRRDAAWLVPHQVTQPD
ncbi:hypothetical protein [Ferrovum sp.]|uniref:hypothetical protein n=1 Tax=Ferrovum sp. TaxID=2609467 RepID=UPI00260D7E29|nr:hypothetical protein [Ferrovum sp.]